MVNKTNIDDKALLQSHRDSAITSRKFVYDTRPGTEKDHR